MRTIWIIAKLCRSFFLAAISLSDRLRNASTFIYEMRFVERILIQMWCHISTALITLLYTNSYWSTNLDVKQLNQIEDTKNLQNNNSIKFTINLYWWSLLCRRNTHLEFFNCYCGKGVIKTTSTPLWHCCATEILKRLKD